MTQIGIRTQSSIISVAFATDTSALRTISAVDVTRSYVQLNGWASGKPLCVTCIPNVSTPKGTADDGITGQWAVELLNSTTVRGFRNTPSGAGCRVTLNFTVVEYT